MNIAKFAVRNTILAWMLTLLVFVGGFFVIESLQREVFPITDLDIVVVRTAFPNASPEEVEEQITLLIEDELKDVNDIDEYSSTSSESISIVVIQIEENAENKFRVLNDVQRKIDAIDDFPEDAEDPVVEMITTDEPVIRVCVSGDMEERALRIYAEDLEVRLKRIPDVSTVERQGWRDEEFWVECDLEALESFEISLTQVMAALARSNVSLPGGRMTGSGKEVILRTVGKFRTAEEIGEVVVRSNIDGRSVRIKDIAKVSRQYEEDSTYAKANGVPTLILPVKKKAAGDAIDVADGVKAIVDEANATFPDDVQVSYVDDSSYYVKRRLNVLANNAGAGLILVMICLFVSLNWRVAIFTSLGIPFAFMGALIAMTYYGMTINLMTMFGLIIVLGMVVDDSIIVGENIFRHLELGKTAKQAAIDGTHEVQGPVISTVLTTVAAFFPLLFAPDLYKTYLGWLVLSVMITLAVSLVECLFVMPSHIADFAGAVAVPRDTKHKLPRGPLGAFVSGFRRCYEWSLHAALRHRYLFIVGLVVLAVAGAIFLKSRARVVLFPGDMIDIVFAYVETPIGTSQETTAGIVEQVEAKIDALPEDELADYVTYMGQHLTFEAGVGVDAGSHLAQFFIYLTPQETRERKTAAVIGDLREACAGLEGLEKPVAFEFVSPGPPVGKPVEVRVFGAEIATMRDIAAEVKEFVGTIGNGVTDVDDDFGEGKEELHVLVNEAEGARFGVSRQDVAQTVFLAVEGGEATAVREGKDELEVRVMLQTPERDDANVIPRLGVVGNRGRLIPMSNIAEVVTAKGLPSLRHFNGERVISVGAEIDEEQMTSVQVNALIKDRFSDLSERYPGYRIELAGEWEETEKIVKFMIRAVGFALFMIYTILAVQFRSFFQPLVLLLPIPLSFMGVQFALLCYDKPVSIMAMMGFVGLGGVVVNDAIVLVSFVNRERAEGVGIFDALIAAGGKRLRPIMLTSITTVLGLMPVIYGWGGYEPFIAPAAIVLAFGLLFATFLTLVVVPCGYHIGHDIARGFEWLWAKVRGREAAAGGPSS